MLDWKSTPPAGGRGPKEQVAMVILKLIPRILSPELLSVLARMGHGDEIGEIEDVCSFWEHGRASGSYPIHYLKWKL